MIRLLIFLFPALVDLILGAVFFTASVAIAEAGGSALQVTAISATWAFVYAIACPIIGHHTTGKNSVWLLVAACVTTSTCAVAFIIVKNVYFYYVIMVFEALACALFFPPFQIFMKDIVGGDSKGVVRSTSLYTFSWSMGMGAGPFICGYVWTNFGWTWCHLICLALGLFTAVGIITLKQYSDTHTTIASEPEAQPSEVDYSKMPDLVWLGWICAGVGCLTVATLRSYFPSSATRLEIPTSQQGNTLAIISFTQAFVGLACIKSKFWMYKTGPALLFGSFGIASLIIFGLSTTSPMFYLAAALYGVYSGTFFFYLVFHSLVHPKKSSKYVSINESVVGITAITGPIIAGVLGDHVSLSSPYMVGTILIAIALIIQGATHIRCRSQINNGIISLIEKN